VRFTAVIVGVGAMLTAGCAQENKIEPVASAASSQPATTAAPAPTQAPPTTVRVTQPPAPTTTARAVRQPPPSTAPPTSAPPGPEQFLTAQTTTPTLAPHCHGAITRGHFVPPSRALEMLGYSPVAATVVVTVVNTLERPVVVSYARQPIPVEPRATVERTISTPAEYFDVIAWHPGDEAHTFGVGKMWHEPYAWTRIEVLAAPQDECRTPETAPFLITSTADETSPVPRH
jgi:hypothetical protein